MSDYSRGYDRPNSPPSYLDSDDFRRGQRAAQAAQERSKQAWEQLSQVVSNSNSARPSVSHTSSGSGSSSGSSTIWDTARACAWLGGVLGAVLGYFQAPQHLTYVGVGAIFGAAAGWLAGAALHIALNILAFLLKIALAVVGVGLVIWALLSFLK